MNNFMKYSSLIIFIVVSVGGYVFYQHIKMQEREKVELPQVVEGCITVLKRSSMLTADISGDYSKRENHFRDSINQFLNINNRLEFEESKTAISLCPTLIDSWVDYEKPIFELFVVFSSARMNDINTVKKKEEYEWRLGILDKVSNVEDYLKNSTKKAREILFDKIGKSVVSDRIKTQYYAKINNVFVKEDFDLIMAINFRSYVKSLRGSFEFLYQNQEYFDVDSGQLMFHDEVRLRQYEKIVKELNHLAGNFERRRKK
jgi:hypothetical protein